MNKKSLQTKEKIEKAMFSLLTTISYDQISVAEIAKEADVSRTAFYRNYDQKDDVLKKFIDEQYQSFIADIEKNKLLTLMEELKTYLSYFKRNPHLMEILLNAGFEGVLLNQQTIYLKKLIQTRHPELQLPDYAFSFQSGGIYMTLVWWVREDHYQTSVDTLVQYIQKHLEFNTK